MKDNIKELIQLHADDPIKLDDEYDNCIVGVHTDGMLVYDALKIIDALQVIEQMTEDEAVEHFYYNIECTQHSGGRPIYIFTE
tara:strand:- start:1603 stop:1851 length:249 start_codon:yes stop_codon:yes gene_type:complete